MAYLDWAATAPLCVEAADAMAPYFAGGPDNLPAGGNANSLHSIGREAFKAMEQARHDLASCVGCRPDELFFTAGATESDNMAVRGIANAVAQLRAKKTGKGFKPHVVTSAIEHEAVLEPARQLEREGFAVTYLAPDKLGFVTAGQLGDAMTADTVLVSVMAVNNEVGSIQPVAELSRIAHESGALFHTDAVQAFGKVPLDCAEMGVDAASFSAHKVGGPKGVGALYLRKGTPIAPLMRGGGQESGLRSGTQNVAGMVGFAAAALACSGSDEVIRSERERLMAMRDDLYAFLSGFDAVRASVPCYPGATEYAPHIVNVTVDGIESETIILRMDRAGVYISGGSACSSSSLDPSHVLTALGIGRDRALGALRVSMGRYTSGSDLECFKQAFTELVDWAGL